MGLALAVIWFFTTPVFLALVPHFILSILAIRFFSADLVTYTEIGDMEPEIAKFEVYGILSRLLLGILSYIPSKIFLQFLANFVVGFQKCH
jgi:hypothetical protein